MAVLALLPGARLDPAELIEFLRPRLAHFMIPRYVRITAELPKTPAQKAEKHACAPKASAGPEPRGAGGLPQARRAGVDDRGAVEQPGDPGPVGSRLAHRARG